MDHEAPALLSAFCRLSLDPGDRGSIIDKLGRITTREAELPATPEPAKMKGLARFRPEEFYGDDDYHPKRDSGKVEVASQPHGYIHLACLDCGTGDRCLYETIVIAFDGACTNNGRADATGAMGVYVGGAFTAAGLRFNEARPIRGKATSQIAELVGAIRAVTLAQQVVARRRRPVGGGVTTDTIVLKSDSEYVVKGMTEWINKWEKNGWVNAQGARIANKKLWKYLRYRVRSLLIMVDTVYFWHVPRECNKEADALSRSLGV